MTVSIKKPSFLFKSTLGLLLLSLLLWGWTCLRDPHYFPIRHVRIWATYQHITPDALKQQLIQETHKSFFSLSLKQLETHLLKVFPWIATLAISRQWPDAIKLIITEKIPIAQLNNNWLISKKGIIFPNQDAKISNLPKLKSSHDQAFELLNIYQQIQPILNKYKLQIAELSIDNWGYLTIQTKNHATIELGQQNNLLKKLTQFLSAYPTVLAQNPNKTLKRVDLRYPDGFSVAF